MNHCAYTPYTHLYLQQLHVRGGQLGQDHVSNYGHIEKLVVNTTQRTLHTNCYDVLVRLGIMCFAEMNR